jgi:hypothetical protein
MASAYSTKGTKVCVLKGAATATNATPTAISKAAPAVVTVASTAGLLAGDMVKIPASGATGCTGFPQLDGKSWIVDSVTGTSFTLLGSDTVGATQTLAAGASIRGYNDADFECLCLSSITFNPESTSNVSVATFCDPTATIPSQVVGSGTVDIAGFVDISDAGYKELMEAYEDGKARDFRIKLGNDQGYIMLNGILSALNVDIPIDGATGYTGTISLSSRYRHLF